MLALMLACAPATTAEVWSVEVEPLPGHVFTGDRVDLKATAYDQDGALIDADLTWTSDDRLVAEVADGAVEAVGKGLALVTATAANGPMGSASLQVVHRWSALDMYGSVNCGLEEGSAVCWGQSDDGVFGTPNVWQIEFPGWPAAQGPFQDVEVLWDHACALSQDGTPWCWGTWSTDGGDGAFHTPEPLTAPPLSSLQGHDCGLDAGGDVYCWGWDEAVFNAEAALVFEGFGFVSLSGDAGEGCALDGDGVAWCWGEGPELGNGTGAAQAEPGPVTGGLRWAHVTTASRAACGITVDGDGYCWGHQQGGNLGIGTQDGSDMATPTRLDIDVPLVDLAISGHACALDVDGGTWCWGNNDRGQAGWTYDETARLPVLLDSPPPLVGIEVSEMATCGLASDGAAFCWGQWRPGIAVNEATLVTAEM